jgi:hypothetical protein
MIGKRKPYVAPKAVGYETEAEIPSELRSAALASARCVLQPAHLAGGLGGG